jgi:hypothetical protein
MMAEPIVNRREREQRRATGQTEYAQVWLTGAGRLKK